MRDTLRAQLWPLPTLGVTLAVVAGVGMPRVDKRIQHDMPSWLRDYLFSGNTDAARSVLEAIAGSLVTVTALTFSLTVLTLQLASSQFSPRLLRTFTADRYVQTTLALFLTTFTYALTVLRTVRTGEDEQTGFVPRMSVTVAFLLTLASLLALVLFLSHLTHEIRVETMMSSVHSAADRTIHRLLTLLPIWLRGEAEFESGEVAGVAPIERLAVPPGVQPDEVERDGSVDVFEVGLGQAAVAGASHPGNRYGLSGSGGALPRRRPLRARARTTRWCPRSPLSVCDMSAGC
jgi:uncharacterized membrane protein